MSHLRYQSTRGFFTLSGDMLTDSTVGLRAVRA